MYTEGRQGCYCVVSDCVGHCVCKGMAKFSLSRAFIFNGFNLT